MTPAQKYAEEHGISVRQANRRLLAEGRATPLHRHPAEKVARALELSDDEVPVPMIAIDVGLTSEQVRHILRHHGRRAETTWRGVRVTITNNPALRALHEEIMSFPELT